MKSLYALLPSLLATSLAHAHDGHGLGAAHWHATDTLGYVLLAAMAAAALWAGRRK